MSRRQTPDCWLITADKQYHQVIQLFLQSNLDIPVLCKRRPMMAVAWSPGTAQVTSTLSWTSTMCWDHIIVYHLLPCNS
jgi:hypothetical protein